MNPNFCSLVDAHPIDFLCAALENKVNALEEKLEAMIESNMYHQINKSLGLDAVQCEDISGGGKENAQQRLKGDVPEW